MSTVKKTLLSALIASACFATNMHAQAQTTLTAAVNHTLQTNPDVGVDARQRRAVDEALLGAYAGYLPRVDISWGEGKEKAKNSNTFYKWSDNLDRHEKSITIQENIFDSFATTFEIARNRARMEGAAYRVATSSQEIALKVVEAYLNVLRLRETLRLTQDNLANHQKTYDQIALRAKSGIGRQSDVDQAEARLALAKSNLISAEANLRNAEINYRRYTDLVPDNLIQPDGPTEEQMPKSLEEAQERAKENNPLLKEAEADIRTANAQYNVAKSAFGPKFDIVAGLSYLDNTSGLEGDTDSKYAMLRMNWNLFRGGADTARLGEMKQIAYQATEAKKRAMMQLDESTSVSWTTYVSAHEKLPNLQHHAQSSLSARDAYAKQFSLGQRTLIDLLDTENEYFTSTVEYVNGQYQELFASYRLMADMGQLLEVLKATPLVESDPTRRVNHSNPWFHNDEDRSKLQPTAQTEEEPQQPVLDIDKETNVEGVSENDITSVENNATAQATPATSESKPAEETVEPLL